MRTSRVFIGIGVVIGLLALVFLVYSLRTQPTSKHTDSTHTPNDGESSDEPPFVLSDDSDRSRSQPIPGITLLTHTPNDDLDPVWSPDGQRIAFVAHHDGNPEIYMLELSSGALTNLSHSPRDDYAPIWSPNGRYIAFRQRGYSSSGRLIVAEVATGALLEPTIPIWLFGISFEQMTWTLRNDLVVEHVPYDPVYLYLNQRCLTVYELPSFRKREIACSDVQLNFFTSLSPDRHWVISRLNLIEIDTGKSKRLPVDEGGSVVWSPDSRKLALNTGHSILVYYPWSNTLFKVFEAPWSTSRINVIGWSPTGELAWSFTVVGNSSRENNYNPSRFTTFYVLESTDGLGFLNVRWAGAINHPVEASSWSPSGRFIGFRTTANIYALDTETSALHSLVAGRGVIEDFQWSPDGCFISGSIVTSTDRHFEMVVVRLGTGQMTLIDLDATRRGMSWSSNSKQLVVSCGAWTKTNLCLLKWPDGSVAPDCS